MHYLHSLQLARGASRAMIFRTEIPVLRSAGGHEVVKLRPDQALTRPRWYTDRVR